MSEKYQFCVKIPVDGMDALEEFKAYVASQWGELRGHLGEELIKALRIYNMIHELNIYDDAEFLKPIVIAGVRATGSDVMI